MTLNEFESSSLPYNKVYFPIWDDIEVRYLLNASSWQDKEDGGHILSFELCTSIGTFNIHVTSTVTEEWILSKVKEVIEEALDDSE